MVFNIPQLELDDPVSFPAVNGISNVYCNLNLVWFVSVKKIPQWHCSKIS